jgi:hypothetical protein
LKTEIEGLNQETVKRADRKQKGAKLKKKSDREKNGKKCRNEGIETDNEKMEKERLLSFGMLRRGVRW